MTTQSNENDSKDLDIIDADIKNHRLRAFLIIVLVLVTYLFLFSAGKDLPESTQAWGTFGDFIGGILNPIFALFAFYWLTYSVRLQIKELKDTRKELQKAANAQEAATLHQEKIATLEQENVNTQKEILKLQETNIETQKQILESQQSSQITQMQAGEAQQQQIALQNFESLFFQLLKTKTDATNEIIYRINKKNMIGNDTLHGKNAIKNYINNFKSNDDKNLNWEEYYTEKLLDIFGSYFRVCYQIVKLIDKNKTLKNLGMIQGKYYSHKQKEYFDIFRATLTQHELEAFFLNCLSKYGNGKFKKLIEKYGLFEPLIMNFSSSSEQYYRLYQHAYKYHQRAFENNTQFKKYFEEINTMSTKHDSKSVNIHAKHLINMMLHLGYQGTTCVLLPFEKIKVNITEKINEYSEVFIDNKNPHTFEEGHRKDYNNFQNLQEIDFNYEVYMVLKYGINYEEYCNYSKTAINNIQ